MSLWPICGRTNPGDPYQICMVQTDPHRRHDYLRENGARHDGDCEWADVSIGISQRERDASLRQARAEGWRAAKEAALGCVETMEIDDFTAVTVEEALRRALPDEPPESTDAV